MSCLMFLIPMFLVLTTSEGKVKVLEGRESTWDGARKECQSLLHMGSCDLVTATSLNLAWTSLNLLEEHSFWVGAQRFERWLWDKGNGQNLSLFQDHGCVKLPTERSRPRSLSYNDPQKCYTHCEDSRYMYLQDDGCYCTNELQGEHSVPHHCPLWCERGGERCGGKDDYFSLYSLPANVQFLKEDAATQCAVGEMRGNVLHVQTASCTSSHHYFCASDLQREEIAIRSETFDRAETQCMALHNSMLPTLSDYNHAEQLLADLKSLSAKVTGVESVTFWLPLKKHTRLAWVDGTLGEEGGTIGDCVAATVRTASYRLSDFPCSSYRGVICDCIKETDKINPGDTTSKEGKSTNRIAIGVGAAIAGVLIAAIIGFTIVVLRRRMRYSDLLKRQWENRSENPVYRADLRPTSGSEE